MSLEEQHSSAIKIAQVGTLTQLTPVGSLNDEDILHQLKTTYESCLEKRQIQLILDCSKIKSVNSEALEILLEMHEDLIRLGGWLKTNHLSTIIDDVFRATDLNQILLPFNPDFVDIQMSSIHDGNRRKKIGEILLSAKKITDTQLKEALDAQKKSGQMLGTILLKKGWLKEDDLFVALSEQLKIPYIRLRPGIYDKQVVQVLDKQVALRLKVLPLFKVRDEVTVALNNPQSLPALDELSQHFGCRIRPVLAKQSDVILQLSEAYGIQETPEDLILDIEDDFELIETQTDDDYQAIDEIAEESPIINLVNSIIQRAVRSGASDIHVEPGRTKCLIRCRVDGILYEIMSLRMELHPALISRLKIMANLDIAERRLPQDGRIQVHTQGHLVDLRFSSLPGLWGEKIVLRVLDKNKAILEIDKLGLLPGNKDIFKGLLKKSCGLILVTGPTGSGKTTSLYAALNHISSSEKNIVTIEDPIEYQLDAINQNQVYDQIDLSFAKMLKHVLRQDPDVIMVGEIRERQTAEIAVQAALTGHLVLSTLHTNDSISAITRLTDMGVEPYLLSSALIGVVAQRLIRCVCPECKTTFLAPQNLIDQYGWQDKGVVQLVRGRGCEHCHDSGYHGRLGIHEILVTDPELQNLIIQNPSRDTFKAYIENHNMCTLFDNGLELALQGKTSLEEVSRAINLL